VLQTFDRNSIGVDTRFRKHLSHRSNTLELLRTRRVRLFN